MKNLIKNFILCIIAVLFLSSCRKDVEAGYVGLRVDLLGSDKGVQEEVLGIGRYFEGMNERIYIFPTFQINYVYTRDILEGSNTNEEFSFQTFEGMICTVDLGVAAHFNEKLIPKMFKTYRKGADEIKSTVIRNEVRNVLNKISGNLPVESVYGAGKAKMIDSVKKVVSQNLEKDGIVIDNIYLIGPIRIPESVKTALDAKVQATQNAMKAENNVRMAEANAKIKIVNSEGEAKAMDIIGDAIKRNPVILQHKTIEKWNGQLPQVSNGNSVPFINLNIK